MQLIAVGKLRSGPELALLEKYRARLRPALAVAEVAEGGGAPAEARRREARSLLGALTESAWVVALEPGGAALSSEELADSLRRWLDVARPLVFVVGGAEGLGAEVLARANATLSFGPMTWPHLLVRAMLAEQLYRAQSILAGHPYHRGTHKKTVSK